MRRLVWKTAAVAATVACGAAAAYWLTFEAPHKADQHGGHTGWSRDQLPEAQDGHTVQWQYGQLETGWEARPLHVPPRGQIELGVRDDGVMVWREKR